LLIISSYSWQNTDLASASIVTDNAIAIVRQTIEDFSARFPRHANVTALVEEIFTSNCHAGGAIAALTTRDPPFDYASSSYADSSFLWVNSLWSSFRKKQADVSCKREHPTRYQSHASRQDAASMTPEARYLEERSFLYTFLQDYCLLASKLTILTEVFPACDSVTLGLWELSQSEGEAPFWLLFGLQVFLDIREELDAYTGRGFEDLVHSTKAVLLEVDLHSNLEMNCSLQRFTTRNLEYERGLTKAISQTKRLIKQDVVSYVLEDGSLG